MLTRFAQTSFAASTSMQHAPRPWLKVTNTISSRIQRTIATTTTTAAVASPIYSHAPTTPYHSHRLSTTTTQRFNTKTSRVSYSTTTHLSSQSGLSTLVKSSQQQHQSNQDQHQYHEQSSNSSSGFFHSFCQRFPGLVSFVTSRFLRSCGYVLMVVSGGIAVYEVKSGNYHRMMLAAFFPEESAKYESDLLKRLQHPQVGGLFLDPRPQRARAPDIPLPVMIIIGINVAVFLAHKVPSLGNIMAKHFYTSYFHVHQGKLWHTLVTSVFSHHGGLHLLANMWGLFLFAPPIIKLIGDAEFTLFYLTAGVVAGLFDNLVSSLFRNPAWRTHYRRVPSLGASGAVMALIGATAILFPDLVFNIMFIPYPIRSDQLGPLIGSLDAAGFAYKLVKGPQAGFNIGHACHFGGLTFGYAWTYGYLQHRIPAIKQRIEYNRRKKQIGM